MPTTTALLHATQLARAHVLYVDQGRPPSEVASVLNAEFEAEGLEIKPRQVTEIASYRGWGAEKKARASKNQSAIARDISAVATRIVQNNARLAIVDRVGVLRAAPVCQSR